jgi:hydroxymethylpyrimidine/phosphomethylpyrimidine kinase
MAKVVVPPKPSIALTIAGSDPSGGAGVQADLKTFHQHGVYGTAVITLLTAQSTRGVTRVDPCAIDLVLEQLDVLLADLTPAAAKTGALGTPALIEAVAERARSFAFPLVVDPVLISKHGAPLATVDAQHAITRELLPLATLVTPNAHEAAALSGREVRTLAQAADAARALLDRGARAVLVKAATLSDPNEGRAVDVLAHGGAIEEIASDLIATPHTHGTGCTFSAAIAAQLALGHALGPAIHAAKRWMVEALRRAPGLGHGIGPVDHFAPVPAMEQRSRRHG